MGPGGRGELRAVCVRVCGLLCSKAHSNRLVHDVVQMKTRQRSRTRCEQRSHPIREQGEQGPVLAQGLGVWPGGSATLLLGDGQACLFPSLLPSHYLFYGSCWLLGAALSRCQGVIHCSSHGPASTEYLLVF